MTAANRVSATRSRAVPTTGNLLMLLMRAFFTVLLCGLACSTAIAAADPQANPAVQETTTVVSELSERSKIPKSELNGLLADCNASQQSMYFCAWRDQISADRAFKQALADKAQAHPQCKAALEAKVAKWVQVRDRSCDRSAKNQYGEGSMTPTARLLCVTAENVRKTKFLERSRRCTF
jgi:uncharacterized protein YecT (DUF1311 family)